MRPMGRVAELGSLGCMSTTQTVTSSLTLRRGILFSITVCLVFHVLLFSGYFDHIWQPVVSGEVFAVAAFSLEILSVFCILYRTPLLRTITGPLPGAGRVLGLLFIAACLVFGVMMGVMVVWVALCSLFGVPARFA
jgi:hypothetical protein